MVDLQIWLIRTLRSINPFLSFMTSAWGWAIAESIHFLGLSLLIGTIGVFDLRLMGVAKRIPIAALHRLIPWGLLGYGINVVTGLAFLMTEPDQYIYNPSFHFKMLFMAIAGFNATVFYLTAYRSATAPGAAADAPRSAKIVAAISLCMWIGIIVCGRMVAFYRPTACGPQGPGFLATCYPRTH